MKKKKKWNDFLFDDFFDFEKIEKSMDELMKDFFKDDSFEEFKEKPLVMGFSINVNESGKPTIKEFGNIKRELGQSKITNKREPLFTINDSKKEIIITFELPGAEEKDIDLNVTPKKVLLTAKTKSNEFYKEINLKEKVKIAKPKKMFKNGIFEIILKKEKWFKKNEKN